MSDTFTVNKFEVVIGLMLPLVSLLSIFFNNEYIFIIIASIFTVLGTIFAFKGMKGLAEHYKDKEIYKETRNGTIFGIISFALLLLRLFILSSFSRIWYSSPDLLMVAISWLSIFIVFIFTLLMAWNFRKALYALANHSGKRLFRITGTLSLITTSLLVTLFISSFFGLFPFLPSGLRYISSILGMIQGSIIIIMGVVHVITICIFYSLTDPNTQTNHYALQPTSTLRAKYCAQCGASISPKAVFCGHCGKQSCASEIKYCTFCGTPSSSEAPYCTQCGKQLSTPLNNLIG